MYPAKQTFLVLGLSRSGVAAAEFLLDRKAKVYLYDDFDGETVDRAARTLEDKGGIRVEKEKLSGMPELCDALVLSPGIPIDHPVAVSFKRNKKAVIGETELAARYMRCHTVAVTGTNGKTTTVSMIEAILNQGGLTAKACGNIGSPMISFVSLGEEDFAVAEISSFQLETLSSLRPHVAVILNITEDHLNRHYNMENYIFLKSKLLKRGTEAEFAVLNYDDPIVRSFAERTKSRVVWFSAEERVEGAYLENGTMYYLGEKILETSKLEVSGKHNVLNALAAIAAAKLVGVSNEDIANALISFKGVKHRIEFVGEADGVKYIDDSKGTNVDATLKAVECMKDETVLLLGGKDKGYDYDKLFKSLNHSLVVHVILYGENRFKLFESAFRCGFEKLTLCENFSFATRLAKMIAVPGQTVLLSPASASFDEFAGYEERGDRFVEIVRGFEAEARRKEQREEKSDVVEYGSRTGEDE